MTSLEVAAIFGVALAGSFGHCIGMCGGIVLAYCTHLKPTRSQALFYHIFYNLGRVNTYVFLGVIVGTLGSMFSINPYLRAGFFIVCGIVMFLMGISLMKKIKFLFFLELSLKKIPWYQTTFRKILSMDTPFSLYLLGVLNGFLPCGFLYAFLLSAASAGDGIKGGMIMLIFGIATIVPLFGVGFLANVLLIKIRKIMIYIAALGIIIFGVLMIKMGLQSFYVQEHAHTLPLMGNEKHQHSH
ncbi:MAG: sulfite exporter TauE/SafE family protein [Helicobacter sp.]|nr:sulfite exporter TauE/SafE family protein [Helicobacter sp.]